MDLTVKAISTDFLILGGGTAGCWAALTFSACSDKTALIVEKANMKRSGCLAAGVNALNAYIVPGKTPQDYVDYAKADAEGIARGDLLLTMAEGLNHVTEQLEKLGLTILKNPDGSYAARGSRNIKINGENIKPRLAAAVEKAPRVSVLNRVNAFHYIVRDGKIGGAYAIGVDEPALYVITAKAVLCTTGGAAGLYKPNNPGFSRHKMWYPPFNTGAGLAMGVRAGAELTTLEMRFIALRCKDTIAPTGTLAQGVGALQVNALGEVYEQKYGLTTSQRLHGTVTENLEGRGPCYLRTEGISPQQDEDLLKAYLNMAPGQTLRWIERSAPPSAQNVELEGTEPYIVGGHTASGYWVDTNRETTIRGLFAAGDVAGGCPQKYVTGALVEGELAAKAASVYMDTETPAADPAETAAVKAWLNARLNEPGTGQTADELEEQMQVVMDEYAGGIAQNYRYSAESLTFADEKIRELERESERLTAADMQELVYLLELRERLTLCRTLIAHLGARRETRWRSFAERTDYPEQDDAFLKYVNSRLVNGETQILFRDLVREGERYEH